MTKASKALTIRQATALEIVRDAGATGIVCDDARKAGAHESSLYALKRAGLIRSAWIDAAGAEVEAPYLTGTPAKSTWFAV